MKHIPLMKERSTSTIQVDKTIGLCPITSIVPSTQISMHLNLATSQTNYLKTQQNKQVAFITFMIENQN
jgi:hypothetical protein